MLKLTALPLIWWLRIVFSMLMKFFIYVGAWVAGIHTMLMLAELSCKGWKMVMYSEQLAGYGYDPKGRIYYIDLRKGTYYEVETSEANSALVVPTGSDDRAQDERADDESRD